MTPIAIPYDTRYYMVKTMLEQLEVAFRSRAWKLGPIPPEPFKMMRIGGHGSLVTFVAVILAAEGSCTMEEIQQVAILSEFHDADEAHLSDVSWPQHRFTIRRKVEARRELFKGLKAAALLVPLLDMLDAKHGDGEIPAVILYHEDGHQIASLLEILAYVNAGLAAREDFKYSIDKLRSKLYTPIGRQVFEDLERIVRLPVRSGINWEEALWHNLGFPGTVPVAV